MGMLVHPQPVFSVFNDFFISFLAGIVINTKGNKSIVLQLAIAKFRSLWGNSPYLLVLLKYHKKPGFLKKAGF